MRTLFLAISLEGKAPVSDPARLELLRELLTPWTFGQELQVARDRNVLRLSVEREGAAQNNFQWHAQSETVTLWRNFQSSDSIFHHISEKLWLFSPSLKTVACALEELSLNPSAVADFLGYGMLQNPRATIYKEIQRLPLFTHGTLRKSGLRLENTWNDSEEAPKYRSSLSLHQAFKRALEETVEQSLQNVQAPALSLSGGVDSALLAGPLKRLHPQATAFTSTHRQADPEGIWARFMAEATGLEHHILEEPYGPLFEGSLEHLKASPEPLCNPHFARSHRFYATLVQRGHDAVLLGEDGDALLARDALPDLGWRAFHPCLLQGVWEGWHTFQKRPSIGLKRWWFGTRRRPPLPHNPYHRSRVLPSALEFGTFSHPWKPSSVERLTRFASLGQFFDSYSPDWTRLPIRFLTPLYRPQILKFMFSVPTWPWSLDKLLFREHLAWTGVHRDFTERPKQPLPFEPLQTSPLGERDALLEELDGTPDLEELLALQNMKRDLKNWEKTPTKERLALAISFVLWYKGSQKYIKKISL